MRMVFGAVAAVATMAAAAPAYAAWVIDFEDFEIGEVLNYGYDARLDVPYQFVAFSGEVVANPDGDGKVLKLLMSGPVPKNDIYLSRVREGLINHNATLTGIDVFAPFGGEVTLHRPVPAATWTTFDFDFDITGVNNFVRVRGAEAYIDNLVISDVYDTRVPEPGTWALMMLGFGAMGAALRRRRTALA